jgi:hypothetical protein
MEKMAVFLCFNLFNLLRTWWVLGKPGFSCLDHTLERIIPDQANNVRFFSALDGLCTVGGIFLQCARSYLMKGIYDRRYTPTTAPAGDSGSRIVSVRPEEAA